MARAYQTFLVILVFGRKRGIVFHGEEKATLEMEEILSAHGSDGGILARVYARLHAQKVFKLEERQKAPRH